MNAGGDFLQRIFDGKMTGFETMHLGMRQIFQVRLAAFACKKDIVLTPEDDCLRLQVL
jgi:hypothetical protein